MPPPPIPNEIAHKDERLLFPKTKMYTGEYIATSSPSSPRYG